MGFSDCISGFFSIVAAALGAYLAGWCGYNAQVKLRNKEKNEKQNIYRSSMRLLMDDLIAEYGEIHKSNLDTLSHNDQQNVVLSQRLDFKEILIPSGLRPEHWHDHSLLGREGAKDVHRLYKLLENNNDYILNPQHARPTSDHPEFKISKYKDNAQKILALLKKIHADLA